MSRVDVKRVSRARLVNLASADTDIAHIRAQDNKLFDAIRNLSTAIQQIANNNFPAPPKIHYFGRVIGGGDGVVVGENLLENRYQSPFPVDPTGNWFYESITLTGCSVALQTPTTTGEFIVDLLVQQVHRTTEFKSLFQDGFSPRLPEGVLVAHNVRFAINTLFHEDSIRFDVIQTDGIAAGVEVLLSGYYNLRLNDA